MESSSHVADVVLNISKFVIVLLIGVLSGVLVDPYLPSFLSNTKKGYESGNVAGYQVGHKEGFAAARKAMEGSGLANTFKVPDDIRILPGTVTAIDGARVTFHLSFWNSLDDQSLADRVIITDASTTVIALTNKDPKVYLAEMSAFAKKKQVATTALPPSEFIVASSSVSKIKIGDSINVLATQNIKMLKEFSAQGIQIVPKVTTNIIK